jgi:hypothetical protein
MRRVKWYFKGYLLSIKRYGNKEEGSDFYGIKENMQK